MDRLIYTALSGLDAAMTRQRVIASNMANAQTIGFRAETVRFTPVTLEGPSLEARAMSQGAVHGAEMAPGALTQTGNALDLAMNGDALLTVQGVDGSEAYTRRGDLSVGPSGVLQNGDGRPVVGEGGPISVPPGAAVTIAPDGQVLLRDAANPDAPPVRLDRIKLASPAGSQIAKGLDGLFRVSGGGVLPMAADGAVTSGALEQSNVNPTEVLTDMIAAQRLFDMRTKLISTAKDLDEGSAALMRLS